MIGVIEIVEFCRERSPADHICFNDAKYDRVKAYLNSSEGKQFSSVLEWASATIDGFESPLGMELLATIDRMMQRDGIEPTVVGVMDSLKNRAGERTADQWKLKIFGSLSPWVETRKLT
uniref:hypothetical protein n=1 Tax=Pannonibacter phragmitetus TaxID=121719 RepID=UPI000B96D1B2|nr:hypothetical protein [Pannonibacter phragmitetus]